MASGPLVYQDNVEVAPELSVLKTVVENDNGIRHRNFKAGKQSRTVCTDGDRSIPECSCDDGGLVAHEIRVWQRFAGAPDDGRALVPSVSPRQHQDRCGLLK
jgi:hypothetical protein